jgi:hypothetical protein
MALREVDQKNGDQALKNNGRSKIQDCQWLELQDINNFINIQRFAHLEEPYSSTTVV